MFSNQSVVLYPLHPSIPHMWQLGTTMGGEAKGSLLHPVPGRRETAEGCGDSVFGASLKCPRDSVNTTIAGRRLPHGPVALA